MSAFENHPICEELALVTSTLSGIREKANPTYEPHGNNEVRLTVDDGYTVTRSGIRLTRQGDRYVLSSPRGAVWKYTSSHAAASKFALLVRVYAVCELLRQQADRLKKLAERLELEVESQLDIESVE